MKKCLPFVRFNIYYMKCSFYVYNSFAFLDGLPGYVEELTGARPNSTADVFINSMFFDEEGHLTDDVPKGE